MRLLHSSRAVAVWLAAVLLAGISCDKMPLTAPSGTAMTLVATTNALPVNGTTDIVAVLVEGGQFSVDDDPAAAGGVGTPVHNGTLVTFLTTLGRIEPAEARTQAGRATVRLVADGRSGIATVTAFSGAATKTIDVNIGAAAATRIAVTANPQALPGTGGTTTISARVEDQQANGLSGVPVTFSTSEGNLSATLVITDEQGIAKTSLTTTQEATVTASTGGSVSALTGTVVVTLSPRTTIAIAAPTSATVAVPASFTFTPSADAIITDVVIDWGDGSGASLGAITGATTLAHAFRRSGTITVTARAFDSSGGSGEAMTQVTVAPLLASVSFAPNSATQPRPGDPVVFTVTTTPSGALIQSYEWDFGDGQHQTGGSQVTHVYGSTGVKVVKVTVVPVGGGAGIETLTTVDVRP